MPFDKPTRNALARLVGAARDRLIEDLTAQLQTDFRLQPDGSGLPLDGLSNVQRAAAEDLRELLAHYRAALPATERRPGPAAFDRLVREIGFTVLNRLAALRLGEERGLVVECVRQGMASEGFQLYELLASGSLGSGYAGYRAFLYNIFDELALDLGPLFDTSTPLSHVFPTERALLDVLALLNTAELTWIWREDETIGWIYQYYNDETERRQMRDASQAPRNSRELAVRNQFFTPRYVVEFLTDNTLGRLWYEMRAGDTRLAEECRYLVKQPAIVGATSPPRPKKDPRTITMLDPAGGSGHFGLYCFDLFETIYAEAWDDPDVGPALRADYADRTEYERAVPRLILAHNIHIIDIDPRAVQIAALALWLRAQRSYQRLSLKAADRPSITRVNVVCAEPMPGDKAVLDDFLAELRPRVLGGLVRVVFDKMQLAGEAGSLLKIEDELRESIASAKKQWQAGDKAEQLALLPDAKRAPAAEQLALFDVSDISDEFFWDEAEARVIEALSDYAVQAANGNTTRRALFAHDAAQGFAFIELCRKAYDIVLMNPPFGDHPASCRDYLYMRYPDSKQEIYCSFITRGSRLLSSIGLVGALTTRNGYFLGTLTEWRQNNLHRRGLNIPLFADLGWGVLDGSTAEAAAVTFDRCPTHDLWALNGLREADKQAYLFRVANAIAAGQELPTSCIRHDPRFFTTMPRYVLAYWMPASALQRFSAKATLAAFGYTAKQGIATSDNFRFLRTWYEVAAQLLSSRENWIMYAKGGTYQPFFSDQPLLLNWSQDGAEIKAYSAALFGSWSKQVTNTQYFNTPGLTYSRRSRNPLSSAFLGNSHGFDVQGACIFPREQGRNDATMMSFLAGVTNSRMFNFLLNAGVGPVGNLMRTYPESLILDTPVPEPNIIDPAILAEFEALATRAHSVRRHLHQGAEESRQFLYPWLLELSVRSAPSLRVAVSRSVRVREMIEIEYAALFATLDLLVIRLYDGTEDEAAALAADYPLPVFNPTDAPTFEEVMDVEVNELALVKSADDEADGQWQPRWLFFHPEDTGTTLLEWKARKLDCSLSAYSDVRHVAGIVSTREIQTSARELLSYLVGVAMGRWDMRFPLDFSLLRPLPGPFEPLQICPPGTLVGPNGLPAVSGRIAAAEWLRACLTAGTLPMDGLVRQLTISDSEYPVQIAWDGILVDDPGLDPEREDLHLSDIVRRVREALEVLWGARAGAIEQEACEILGVRDLREYLRKPGSFFADHLKRYSKSRRQAPIYWPLSTASGEYTIWVYYHRLTADTLYSIVNGYVKPKIDAVQTGIERLTEVLGEATGRQATALRDEIENLRRFLGELKEFQAELLRVAALPYRPNLNDGVILNAAPLHKLFRHRKWAADCKAAWEKLEGREYEWAHMAYTIWPKRVQNVCETDRSIAIAHGLEELYKGEVKPAKGKQRRKRQATTEDKTQEMDLE